MRVSILPRAGLPLLIAALVWLSLVGVAAAQGPTDTNLELRLPTEGAVGQEMTVEARLTDESGVAVIGAEIVFRRVAEYMNATSELEIGRALTDERGVSTVSFVPRSEGQMLITALFVGDNQYGPTSISEEIPIQTGPSQYREEAGVDVPGINVSLLAGILGGVWGTYFVVMTLLWLIAREGAEPPPYIGGVRE
ncbi:MAG: hypothetical protein ACE5IA_08510 [Dehalococcoidia bacterium]